MLHFSSNQPYSKFETHEKELLLYKDDDDDDDDNDDYDTI